MLDEFITKTVPLKTNCEELECEECTTDLIDNDKCDHSVD